jgi:glutamyl-tRNA synthetase
LPRSRFAPSPTGDLHLGNARTALLAWLQARAAGGAFVMRVEDLDEGRVREEYIGTQLADLRWLGLDWDEGPDVGGESGPYLQSQRLELYEEAIQRLTARGMVYECFCSRREVAAAARAPHGPEDEGPVYPGTCRDRTYEQARRRGPKRAASLRFRVPEGELRFTDLVQGEQVVRPEEELGDFVIRRRDGVPAYQLAVVVDDIAMAITDVLRGADLLASTARQLLLYAALGSAPPRWIHVPLMLAPDGERLSKRHGATTLGALRARGVAADEVVGWLASTCGLARTGERLSPAELVQRFSLDRLPQNPTRPARLPWS